MFELGQPDFQFSLFVVCSRRVNLALLLSERQVVIVVSQERWGHHLMDIALGLTQRRLRFFLDVGDHNFSVLLGLIRLERFLMDGLIEIFLSAFRCCWLILIKAVPLNKLGVGLHRIRIILGVVLQPDLHRVHLSVQIADLSVLIFLHVQRLPFGDYLALEGHWVDLYS